MGDEEIRKTRYIGIHHILCFLSPSLHREGDLRVIRPFVFVREKELRHFAEKSHLPVISENCPACFEAPKVSWLVSDKQALILYLVREGN